ERPPRHGLGDDAVELGGVRHRERELDEAVVEERQPRLDTERHAAPVLVAEQARELACGRVERELAPQRRATPRRPRRVRLDAAKRTREHATLPLAVAAAEGVDERPWQPGLKGVEERRGEAEPVRDVAPEPRESRPVAGGGEVAEPRRQVA